MRLGRALVVGGGIGGLAAATALAQRGVEAEVVERRAEFADPGVGLGQPANALRALAALGVLDEIRAAGFAFQHLRIYAPDGALVVDHRFRLGDEELPAFIALPRVDLHRILLGAAEAAGVPVRMASSPTALRPEGDRVAVGLGGGEERFDLVAGFDGYRSWTRRTAFGEEHGPRPSGYTFWRLIVPRPEDVTCMQFHQGYGHKTGVMPLTAETMYLFHIRPEPVDLEVAEEDRVEALRGRLADYGGLIGALRDGLGESDTVVISPLEPFFLPAPWHRGRVVVGGDAAHTYPPHMTQGAAMALEDALTLADEVTRHNDLEPGLRAYSERRLERSRYVERFAGRMLRDEQRIRSEADFEQARRSGYDGLDERLTESDLVMNEDVLGLGEPTLP